MRMRRNCLLLVSVPMLVGLIGAWGSRPPGPTSADRKELAALVQELDAAYNVQDVTRFCAVFAEDANFAFPAEGIALHGRDEIRRHFAQQFAAHPELRHVTRTGELDAVGSSVLAVDILVDILVADPKTGEPQKAFFHYQGLGLGVRIKAGWRIRTVRLFPMAQSPVAESRTTG
jgi:uncharacterized protein (TIGR02246 family)